VAQPGVGLLRQHRRRDARALCRLDRRRLGGLHVTLALALALARARARARARALALALTRTRTLNQTVTPPLARTLMVPLTRWAGMDARGVGVSPVRNDASPAAAYFLAWMIVGCFVAINLFVGATLAAPPLQPHARALQPYVWALQPYMRGHCNPVCGHRHPICAGTATLPVLPLRAAPRARPPRGAIVDNFTRIKKATAGSASMTPEQKQWADSMRASLSGQAWAWA
jgi:hypothetical protein